MLVKFEQTDKDTFGKPKPTTWVNPAAVAAVQEYTYTPDGGVMLILLSGDSLHVAGTVQEVVEKLNGPSNQRLWQEQLKRDQERIAQEMCR